MVKLRKVADSALYDTHRARELATLGTGRTHKTINMRNKDQKTIKKAVENVILDKGKDKEKRLGLTIGGRWRFKDAEGRVRELTLRQKEFAENYLKMDGKRVPALMATKGYKPKNANTARQMAYQLLTNANVVAYIETLLDAQGLNEHNVKKQHAFLLKQQENLQVKAKAVEMFYKTEGKYNNDGNNSNKLAPVGVFSLADVAQKAEELREIIAPDDEQ